MKRRDFLKYSAAAVPVTPAASVAALTGCGGSVDPAIARQPIASEVFTTTQYTVVPGPKPAAPLHLNEVARFPQYGYGTWTLGRPLPIEVRTDLMPAAYDATAVSKKSAVTALFYYQRHPHHRQRSA